MIDAASPRRSSGAMRSGCVWLIVSMGFPFRIKRVDENQAPHHAKGRAARPSRNRQGVRTIAGARLRI
jgi:hypothetical protein